MTPAQHKAPWTPDQVKSLNGYQASTKYHPYTCRDRSRRPHKWRLGDKGILVATIDGWYCPDCNAVTQTWAHDFTLNWAWQRQP